MPTKPSLGYSYSPSRRHFLSTGAVAALSAPAIVSRSALASSGALNLLGWNNTMPASLIESFSRETGIQVRQVSVGSNEEILNKMRATKGRGIDLLCPTNTRAHQWAKYKLLQAFDFNKLARLDALHPNMLETGKREWNFNSSGPLWLPYVWGSEAIAWRTDMWQPPSKTLSYGDLWQPELEGLLMMQPHSGMLAAGLALEARGELAPGAMRAAYDNEDQMRLTWQQVTAFCVRHKSQVKLFWNDANAQVNALLNEGVMAGQAWDGPALALRTHGEPIDYRAPREGALAWVDGFALSGEAKNLPQAYAFLDFCFDAQRAGEAIREHGYNSAVIGAEKFADKAYRENYQAAYQADDVQNLWIWPSEPAWYAKARKEFRNQFVNA